MDMACSVQLSRPSRLFALSPLLSFCCLLPAGRAPVLIAEDLPPLLPTAAPPGAGPASTATSAAALSALVPLVGVQLPGGCRLTLRWGGGGSGFALSGRCGCVDDMLAAAQEAAARRRAPGGAAAAGRDVLFPSKVRDTCPDV